MPKYYGGDCSLQPQQSPLIEFWQANWMYGSWEFQCKIVVDL